MNYFDILLAKKLEDDRDPKVEGLSVTENGRYHEDGVVYDPVIVNVPAPVLDELTVTQNGTYTAPTGTGYNEVDVDVPLPSNAYLLKEIEDVEIASFNDGSDLSMPKLEVAIEPVQEGSGDPSPENIRPIIGWDEVNVSVTGINIWDGITESGRIDTITGENVAAIGERSKNPVPVKPNKTIYIKSDNNIYIIEYGADKSYIKYSRYYTNTPFTTGATTHYIRFYSVVENGLSGVSINYPSTDTSYHAYNGQTYTIQFKDGDNPLIVYGGSLDVVSGELTVDRAGVVFDGSNDENWVDNMFQYGYSINKGSFKSNVEGQSNYLKYSFGGLSDGSYYIGTSYLNVRLDSITSLADFKTYLSSNPLQICSELATPTTIQLTPTVVKSLRGKNNVFADSGNILDLSYLAKEE